MAVSVSEVEQIRKDMDADGVRLLEVARAIGMPYSSLICKLNGYAGMSDEQYAKLKAAYEEIKARQAA